MLLWLLPWKRTPCLPQRRPRHCGPPPVLPSHGGEGHSCESGERDEGGGMRNNITCRNPSIYCRYLQTHSDLWKFYLLWGCSYVNITFALNFLFEYKCCLFRSCLTKQLHYTFLPTSRQFGAQCCTNDSISSQSCLQWLRLKPLMQNVSQEKERARGREL